jgi:hypothetical protein
MGEEKGRQRSAGIILTVVKKTVNTRILPATKVFFCLSDKKKGMKTFVIASLSSILFFSCKKSAVEGRQMVTGKWELRQSAGGFAGTINYEPGNGTAYIFDNTKGYQFITSTGIARSGTYEINKSSNSGDWLLKLQYIFNNQAFTENDSIRFDKNKLIFLPSASCCDIPTISYEQIK